MKVNTEPLTCQGALSCRLKFRRAKIQLALKTRRLWERSPKEMLAEWSNSAIGVLLPYGEYDRKLFEQMIAEADC